MSPCDPDTGHFISSTTILSFSTTRPSGEPDNQGKCRLITKPDSQTLTPYFWLYLSLASGSVSRPYFMASLSNDFVSWSPTSAFARPRKKPLIRVSGFLACEIWRALDANTRFSLAWKKNNWSWYKCQMSHIHHVERRQISKPPRACVFTDFPVWYFGPNTFMEIPKII